MHDLVGMDGPEGKDENCECKKTSKQQKRQLQMPRSWAVP